MQVGSISGLAVESPCLLNITQEQPMRMADESTPCLRLTAEQARCLCSQFLGGSWAACADGFQFAEIRGGLSNYLFQASLNDSVHTQPDEPTKVLIRVFGEILSQNAESVVLDSVIFALLSEKRMGPRLYGVFKGGRIEEFVPNSVPLKRQQLLEPEINLTISKHLARLHRLDMPLSKEPRFVFRMMQSWLRSIAELGGREELQRERFNTTPVAAFMTDYRVTDEIEWLKDVFQNQFNFPVVFCHNDLQENNILFFEDSTRKQGFNLQLIDFEYCSYNWRAFDVGNFFNEWAMDYTFAEWPYFSFHPEAYPSRETQLKFWRSYLRWYREPRIDDKVPLFPRRWSADSNSANNPSPPAQDAQDDLTSSSSSALAAEIIDPNEESQLLLEANYGALMSHFFWSIWSLLQASVSTIHFDFKEYALLRFRLYAKLKSELTGKPSGLPNE